MQKTGEIANSNSLVRSYLKEYMQLMIKDDSLCVGAIMEAAAQMRRVTQGIGDDGKLSAVQQGYFIFRFQR